MGDAAAYRHWTDAELELLADRSLAAAEVAAATGRTETAVRAARSKAATRCGGSLFSASQVIVQNGCVTAAAPFISMRVVTLHPAHHASCLRS